MVDRFLFANDVRVYQFKAKYSAIKPCPLCLGNISKDFIDSTSKKPDWMEMCKIDIILVILWTFVNIWWKKHDIV